MKLIKNFLFFFIIVIVVALSCTKKYGYDFENGTGTSSYEDSTGLEIDTAMDRIDGSKFTAAQIYPGMVNPGQRRISDTTINVNLDYQTATSSDLRVSVTPTSWISTGLWAPAGELVRIIVPEGIYGLTVQVGSHTDNLTGKDVLQRDPIIYIRKTLYPGVNYVRNLYGGLIYIIPQRPLGKVVPMKFAGVCAGANFILGEMSDEQWRQMINNTSVPFFELIGKRIAFTLPKSNLSLSPIPSPTALMEKWDSLIKAVYYDWYGLTDRNADPRHRTPFLPWRIVFDIQPSLGAMHSGSPVVAGQTSRYFFQAVTIAQLEKANWGVFHEIGHNMQMGSTWSFNSNGEVTNNLFSLKKSSIYGYTPGELEDGWYGTGGQTPGAASFVVRDTSEKDWTSTANLGAYYPRLSFYAQIFEKYGYGFMTYLTTAARDARFTSIDDQSKIDFYYERLSEYTQTDMYRFMREWGLLVSQTSRNAIAAKGYPKLKTQLWLYNPITNTGGDEPIPRPKTEHNRSNWLISLPNAQSNYQGPRIIDGDPATFWHSCYNGGCTVSNDNFTYRSTSASYDNSYPQFLEVNTVTPITASGFYIQQRNNPSNNNNHVSEVTVEISSDGVNWEEVATYPLQWGNQESAWEVQYLDFPSGEDRTFQYFRYTWPKPNNDVNSAFAEIGTFRYQ